MTDLIRCFQASSSHDRFFYFVISRLIVDDRFSAKTNGIFDQQVEQPSACHPVTIRSHLSFFDKPKTLSTIMKLSTMPSRSLFILPSENRLMHWPSSCPCILGSRLPYRPIIALGRYSKLNMKIRWTDVDVLRIEVLEQMWGHSRLVEVRRIPVSTSKISQHPNPRSFDDRILILSHWQFLTPDHFASTNLRINSWKIGQFRPNSFLFSWVILFSPSNKVSISMSILMFIPFRCSWPFFETPSLVCLDWWLARTPGTHWLRW